MIVNVRLDGDEQAVKAAIALLEYALGDIVHLTPPRLSTRAKYAGSALARGTLRIPESETEAEQVERQIKVYDGKTRKLRGK
jgi:hypothetical protein